MLPTVQGEFVMLEKQDAILIQEHALAAIRELSMLIQRAEGVPKPSCPESREPSGYQ